MAPVTYHDRKADGTLGDVIHYRKGAVYDAPQYYVGFWFPTLRTASEILNKDPEIIYSSITSGYVEQDGNKKTRMLELGSGRLHKMINYMIPFFKLHK